MDDRRGTAQEALLDGCQRCARVRREEQARARVFMRRFALWLRTQGYPHAAQHLEALLTEPGAGLAAGDGDGQ